MLTHLKLKNLFSDRRQEQEYLNLMMKSLIESGKTSNLACCFSFLDCFYKILDKSTLRSLAASAVVDRLNKEQQVQLYDFCCKREIYPTYTVSNLFIHEIFKPKNIFIS